jgi:hypothetical protein
MRAPLPDLERKHRPKSATPESDGFMADSNAMFVLRIFDASNSNQKPTAEHRRWSDDLGHGLNYRKGLSFSSGSAGHLPPQANSSYRTVALISRYFANQGVGLQSAECENPLTLEALDRL